MLGAGERGSDDRRHDLAAEALNRLERTRSAWPWVIVATRSSSTTVASRADGGALAALASSAWRFSEAKPASDLVIAVVGISLNEAAYAAEVVRAGILSVDQGQHEAASALGLPQSYRFRHVVLPQALRAIIPSYVKAATP